MIYLLIHFYFVARKAKPKASNAKKTEQSQAEFLAGSEQGNKHLIWQILVEVFEFLFNVIQLENSVSNDDKARKEEEEEIRQAVY